MLAASSDIKYVSALGGCQGHLKGEDDIRLIIECPIHEPILAKMKDSWGSVNKPPLTRDEKEAAEAEAEQANSYMAQLAKATAHLAAEEMTKTKSTRATSVKKKIEPAGE